MKFSQSFDYFDLIVKEKRDGSITFICFESTLMIYDFILDEVVKIYGEKETVNDDYLTELVRNDREWLSIAVKTRSARIFKKYKMRNALG